MAAKSAFAPQLHVRVSSFDHPNCTLKRLLCDKLHGEVSAIIVSEDKLPDEGLCRLWGPQGAFFYSIPPPITADVLLAPSIRAQAGIQGSHLVATTSGSSLGALDAAVAQTSDGWLHVAVSSERYRALGLEGARSRFEEGERYQITVHTRAESFQPGSHHYDRVRACLAARLPPAELLLARASDGPTPSSLPIDLPPGAEDRAEFRAVSHSREERRAEEAGGTGCPRAADLSAAIMDDPGEQGPSGEPSSGGSSIEQRHEVLGALLEFCGAVLSGSAAGGPANCEPPLPDTPAGIMAQPDSVGYTWPLDDVAPPYDSHVAVHRWTGLIPGPLIWALVRGSAALIDGEGQGRAYALVYSRAPPGCPVGFAGAERGAGQGTAGLGAEDDMCILVLPGGRYAVFALSGEDGGCFSKF